MQVAVIVPAFNAAATIEQCLRSITGQTRLPDEVIVVDDASTDRTSEIARATDTANLRVVRLERKGGPGRARNQGVQLARAEWICFLDADDEWRPERLAASLSAVLAHSSKVVGCGGVRTMLQSGGRVRVRDFTLPGPPDSRDISADYWRLPIRPLTPVGLLVHRTAFEAVGGFPEDMRRSEDTVLNARLWLETDICFVNRPLYDSVQRPESLTALPPRYRDTFLLLVRVGIVLLKAARRRRAGTRALLRRYPHMVRERHAMWLAGRRSRGVSGGSAT